MNKHSDFWGSKSIFSTGKIIFLVFFVSLLLLLLILTSLSTGSNQLSITSSIDHIFKLDFTSTSHIEIVIWTLRLPRILSAILIGIALGISGALLQMVTRNPLAEPGILGVNSGAALGVVSGITFFNIETGLGYLVFSFIGSFVGSLSVVLVSITSKSKTSPLHLVLIGIAFGITFKGFTSFLLMKNKFTFDQYRYWILGSLSGISMDNLVICLYPFFLGLLLTILFLKPISALRLGDEISISLGYRPEITRVIVAIIVTFFTGISVSLAGPIGLLGLLAGNIAIKIAGSNILSLLIVSSLLGVFTLVSSDILAKLIAKPFEIPVSVVIGFIATPLLIWIVKTNKTLSL